MTNMENMKRLVTNRFLTTAVRTLCCAGALSACSAWASVVTWHLSPLGHGATKAFSQSGHTPAAWGIDSTTVTDTSNQVLFRAAPESGTASKTPETLSNNPQPSDTDLGESHSALFQGGGHTSADSTQSDDSLLFAASNTPARPATELDEALARNTFDEEFVAVPTVQFASIAPAAKEISMAFGTAGNIDPAPVPEMSALFPIVGLIVAVSCTQILRRRRAAQQSAFRHLA